LVDEVAEVQDEAQLLITRAALVFPDHPAIGVAGALPHVLAAHEGEADRARVGFLRRGQRAADAAAVAVLVGEAVPVFGRGLEAGRIEAAGPVELSGHGNERARLYLLEIAIAGDFEMNRVRLARIA